MLYNRIYGNMYWIDIEYTIRKYTHWHESKNKNIYDILNGGLSLTLDVSELYSDEEVKNAIESVADLPFFRLMSRILVCNTCGKRSSTQSSERCEYCKSPYLLMI